MNLIASTIIALHDAPLLIACLLALIGNMAMFFLAIAVGHVLVILFKQHPITEPPPPVTRQELILVTLCVILNALVAVVGIVLWRAGIIQVRFDADWRILLDAAVLLIAMDFLMYVFHRAAHIRWLYPFIHETHHRYENPRPLTLFVLNPAEVLGFGFLLVAVLCVYQSSYQGILIYLAFNLAFGLMGHLGVEPLPKVWAHIPLIKMISTSTFHAEHHQDKGHNYGFYTLIWDRLFGTLSPEYLSDFDTAASEPQPVVSFD